MAAVSACLRIERLRDYFAYDLRSPQPLIRYIDPDESVWENLKVATSLYWDRSSNGTNASGAEG